VLVNSTISHVIQPGFGWRIPSWNSRESAPGMSGDLLMLVDMNVGKAGYHILTANCQSPKNQSTLWPLWITTPLIDHGYFVANHTSTIVIK
jgi:hypothetical protein